MTSIVNIKGSVIRDDGPFACALQALERRDFAAAERAISDLLGQEGLRTEDRAFLFNKRGVARMGLEQRATAQADFGEALRHNPCHAPALTNFGNVLLEEGDVDGAIAYYLRAISADECYAIAHLNLSVAYKRVGRRNDAVRELRQAQRLEERVNASNFFRRARSP